jgi:hypothetical protein
MVKQQWICMMIANLSPINQIQKQVFVSGKQYINKEAIRSG